jgi:hypothetical protein
MFQILVSHNKDLERLVEKGYAVAFDSNHLIIRDIPYLDRDGALQMGAIVAKLEFLDQNVVRQTDHQIFFAGSVPFNLDGTAIPNLAGGECTITLSEGSADVKVQRSFSNKPRKTGKFEDFFHKIESYVTIISGPAIEKCGVSPFTFRAVQTVVPDGIFKFHDTLTSRAEITDLVANLKKDVIAVIGLGGTGSYVLDFLVKTPVKEVRGFDHDSYYVHNAFRSPGRVDEAEFRKSKAEVYRARHENFRHGYSVKNKLIDASSAADLDGVTFAFVCVDKGTARAGIFDLLLSKRIPFINVGMGLHRKHGAVSGLVRSTYYSSSDGEKVRAKGLAELSDKPDDWYDANIQIAELNALNACLAVVKFKQLRGFYYEDGPIYDVLFDVSDLKIVSESEI